MAIASFNADFSALERLEPDDLGEVKKPEWRMLAPGEDEYLAHNALAEAWRRRAEFRGFKWRASTAQLAGDIAATCHARGQGVSRFGRAIMTYAVGLDAIVGRREAAERVLQGRGYRRARGLPLLPLRRHPKSRKEFLLGIGGSPLTAAFGATQWRQAYDLVRLPEAGEYEAAVEKFWCEVGFRYMGRSPLDPKPSDPATRALLREAWRTMVPHEQDELPANADALAVSALTYSGGGGKVARTARHAALLLVTEPRGISSEALLSWSEALKRPADL